MESCEVLLFVISGIVVKSWLLRDFLHRFLMWVWDLFDLVLEFLAPVHACDILGPFKVR